MLFSELYEERIASTGDLQEPPAGHERPPQAYNTAQFSQHQPGTGHYNTKDTTSSWNIHQVMQHIGKFWTGNKDGHGSDDNDDDQSDEEYQGLGGLRTFSQG